MKSLKYDYFGINLTNSLAIHNNYNSRLQSLKVLTFDGYDDTKKIQSATVISDVEQIPIGVTIYPIEEDDVGDVLRLGIISGVNTFGRNVNDPIYFNENGDFTFEEVSNPIGYVATVGLAGRVFLNIGGFGGGLTERFIIKNMSGLPETIDLTGSATRYRIDNPGVINFEKGKQGRFYYIFIRSNETYSFGSSVKFALGNSQPIPSQNNRWDIYSLFCVTPTQYIATFAYDFPIVW